jgi:hypothetical protein
MAIWGIVVGGDARQIYCVSCTVQRVAEYSLVRSAQSSSSAFSRFIFWLEVQRFERRISELDRLPKLWIIVGHDCPWKTRKWKVHQELWAPFPAFSCAPPSFNCHCGVDHVWWHCGLFLYTLHFPLHFFPFVFRALWAAVDCSSERYTQNI